MSCLEACFTFEKELTGDVLNDLCVKELLGLKLDVKKQSATVVIRDVSCNQADSSAAQLSLCHTLLVPIPFTFHTHPLCRIRWMRMNIRIIATTLEFAVVILQRVLQRYMHVFLTNRERNKGMTKLSKGPKSSFLFVVSSANSSFSGSMLQARRKKTDEWRNEWMNALTECKRCVYLRL